MRPAGALLLSAFLAAPAAAEVTVRLVPATGATASHVELTAQAAPLAEVLDRLGRQIGMKVVYEGASPRQLVTLSLQGRSPAETVLGLLEGQGLNFALVSDPSGTQVVTLLVAGTVPSTGSATPATAATASSRTTTPSTPLRRPLSPPPGSSPDTMEEEPEEGEDVTFDDPAAPAGGAEAGQADPAATNPVPVPQGPGAQPSAPSQSFPVSPFAPQATPYMPQTFPPLPPGVPGGPPGKPTAPAPQTPPETTTQTPPG